MSLLKKLLGETAIYGVSYIVGRLLNYLLAPYHMKVFESTAEFGVIQELYAYVAFLIILFTYRMETGFFRFGAKEENRDKAFSTASISLLITTPILVGTFIVFSQSIANWLQYPDHSEYIIWFALILGFDALASIPFARLRLDSRPIRFASIKLTNILVNIGCNIFFLSICPSLKAKGHDWVDWVYREDIGVGYVFISNLVASTVQLLMMLPLYFKLRLKLDKELWKRKMKYVAPLILAGFAGIINETLDRTLLKKLLPGSLEENLEQLGIYSGNYKLAMLMTILIMAFNYAAEPFFFRNANRDDSKQLYGKIGQGFALVGSLAFLGIMSYLDLIHGIFTGGEKYRAGIHIIPIVLLANFFLGLYYNFGIWFKLSDKTMFGTYIAIGGASITILINVFFIPIYGFTASAWATLACYAFMATVAYLTGQRHYPISYPVKRMALYIIMALIGFGIIHFFHSFVAVGKVAEYGFNSIIFFTFIFIVYQLEKNGLIKAFRNG